MPQSNIPTPGQPNSQARWALRIAWLAQQGINPSDLAKQDAHKDDSSEVVVGATKEMCQSFPKAV